MPTAAGFPRFLYDHSPAFVRGIPGLVPFGWRIGHQYRRTLKFLLKSDRWPAADLKNFQEAQLANLLERAIRNVPYYSRYSGLLGRSPWDILREIEPVDKATIQKDPKRFIDPTFPKASTYLTSTGGTSGSPLEIVSDKRGFQIEWAFMMAQWARAGFHPGMRRATFRGVPFQGGRLWQNNPVYDEVQFSPFAMSELSLNEYVRRIREYKPDFLYGYPSALTILGNYIEGRKISDFPAVRGLLCGSENIQEGQRKFLQSVFSARLFSWYGMSEKVVLAGECEHSPAYHSFPQYGVTEIRTKDGNLSQEAGAEGEVVGTGFINRAMPFIRYRSQDYSSIIGDQCHLCGRHFLLLDAVRGRWTQEMLLGANGAPISITALNMHGAVFSNVLQFQFHQKKKGEVTLRIVPASEFFERDRERILHALKDKTGNELVWKIETVKQIRRTPRGKGIFLIQECADHPDLGSKECAN